jgi:hypothetical protein
MPADRDRFWDETAEFRLVRATAASHLDAERRHSIQSALVNDLDWDAVVVLAETHATSSLLHLNLRKAECDRVPAQVVASLRARHHAQAARNLVLAEELSRLVDVCRHEGIRVLPIKGPTLAVLAYGDLSLRSFVDLDLLIAPQDFDRACQAICAGGCVPAYELTRDEQTYHVATRRQLPFLGRHAVMIELHSSLTDDYYHLPLDFETLWSRRQVVMVAGHELETLSMDDLCLLLVVHGAKHWWSCLMWICDFAELMRPEVSVHWANLLQQARELRCDTMLLLAASLAKNVLHADLPPPLAADCETNRTVQLLTGELEEQLLSARAQRPPRWQEMRYHYRCQGNIGLTLRFFAHMLFQPHLPDWQFVRLPRPLWFLYPVLRPLRLLSKRLRGLFGQKGVGPAPLE